MSAIKWVADLDWANNETVKAEKATVGSYHLCAVAIAGEGVMWDLFTIERGQRQWLTNGEAETMEEAERDAETAMRKDCGEEMPC